MKKTITRIFIITVFLMLSIFMLHADNQTVPIEKINGYVWQTWNDPIKRAYVIGFLSAQSSVAMGFINSGAIQTESDKKKIIEMFYYPFTVEQLKNLINIYYQFNPTTDTIIKAILQIANKHWGDRQ